MTTAEAVALAAVRVTKMMLGFDNLAFTARSRLERDARLADAAALRTVLAACDASSSPSPVEPTASDRDWPVEILTLAADILDEEGRATFGADEAKAIRAVLARLA